MSRERDSMSARIMRSHWFFPVLFPVVGAILALIMVRLDQSEVAHILSGIQLLAPASPESAIRMLTVMAGSMIGTAASVFAITVAAVAFASSNYGPRLMANFLSDRGNQFSLGVFLGCFVYALIVLRALRAGGADTAAFVPDLSLTFAYLLMAVCVAVLIWFLNHVPSSMQIGSVVENVGQRLIDAVKATYPQSDSGTPWPDNPGGEAVLARGAGYIERIDFEALDAIASEHGATFWLAVRTGDFVHRDLPLLYSEGCNPGNIADAVRPHFSLSPTRASRSDPRALIDDLVEIAMRAASPAINDPFTSAGALNWLGAATAELGGRHLHKDAYRDNMQDARVIPCPDDFDHFVERGFGTIRSLAATNSNTAQIMLEALENAGAAITSKRRQETLRAEADKLVEQARLSLAGPDLQAVEDRHAQVAAAIPATPVRAVS